MEKFSDMEKSCYNCMHRKNIGFGTFYCMKFQDKCSFVLQGLVPGKHCTVENPIYWSPRKWWQF
jgi:hypothetical protein